MTGFVPVVAARHQETEWPAVLARDSTRFIWSNSRTGQSYDMFRFWLPTAMTRMVHGDACG